MTGLFSYPKRKMRSLIKKGEYKEAIELGQSIQEKYADDPDYHFIMGSIYYILEDAQNALHYFDRALEINDNDTESLLLKANVHAGTGDPETAASCLRKILDIDPDNMDAKNLLRSLED